VAHRGQITPFTIHCSCTGNHHPEVFSSNFLPLNAIYHRTPAPVFSDNSFLEDTAKTVIISLDCKKTKDQFAPIIFSDSHFFGKHWII
jgi:hypothetical protein